MRNIKSILKKVLTKTKKCSIINISKGGEKDMREKIIDLVTALINFATAIIVLYKATE